MNRLPLLVALFVGACAEPYEEPIAEGPIAGTLNGSAWTPAASELWVPGESAPTTRYELILHKDVPTVPCEWWPSSPDYVLLGFPPAAGTYVLEQDGAVAIWITEDHAPAGLGRMEVSSVSADGARGGVVADFGVGEVSGSFESVTFCGQY